ncbi:unnamed protein product [Brassica oleracea]
MRVELSLDLIIVSVHMGHYHRNHKGWISLTGNQRSMNLAFGSGYFWERMMEML